MVASLLKLLSTGIQTERLYDSNNIKSLYPFVKIWYKVSRYTTRWERIDFDSIPDFGKKVTATLVQKGHLITRVYLVTTFPDIGTIQLQADAASTTNQAMPHWGWTNSLGNALISNISFTIGGAVLSQGDGRLLEMLDEYRTPLEKVPVMNRLLRRIPDGAGSILGNIPLQAPVTTTPLHTLWFSRDDPGNALPISALINDDVRIEVTFNTIQGLVYSKNRLINPPTGTDPGSAFPPIVGSQFYEKNMDGSVGDLIPNIQMPDIISLGDTYLMCEYVYLDKMESSRIQLADIQIPISQHYALKPYDTKGLPKAQIELNFPNPTRDIYWMVQRSEAQTYNAYFLATRDLAAPDASGSDIPWWPDARGLNSRYPDFLYPGFAYSNSEPLDGVGIVYEGTLVRARTEAPALFRSVYPSYEQKKTPWINRYYYNYPMGFDNAHTPSSKPKGEANLDKIKKRELYLDFRPNRGSTNPNNVPNFVVYVWAETYNILRIYGGRGSAMFAY